MSKGTRQEFLGLDLDGPPEGSVDQLATVSAEERRQVCLNGLVKRFGSKAANPIQFVEMDWAAERWSRGDMQAHWAPGVLTGFGRALREACGLIHWAGTETAIQWHGAIEGAIRSGERAADEVLTGD